MESGSRFGKTLHSGKIAIDGSLGCFPSRRNKDKSQVVLDHDIIKTIGRGAKLSAAIGFYCKETFPRRSERRQNKDIKDRRSSQTALITKSERGKGTATRQPQLSSAKQFDSTLFSSPGSHHKTLANGWDALQAKPRRDRALQLRRHRPADPVRKGQLPGEREIFTYGRTAVHSISTSVPSGRVLTATHLEQDKRRLRQV